MFRKALSLLMVILIMGCMLVGGAYAADGPVFTIHPVSQTVTEGETVTLRANTGSDVSLFWWQYRTGEDAEWISWGPEAGNSNGTTLNILGNSKENYYQYRCCAQDANGNTGYSNPATIHVVSTGVKPVISVQPVSTTAEAGESATFWVVAEGAGSYQWQYKSGGNWYNITSGSYSGLQTATMWAPATAGRNGYQFRCAVTNASGTTYSNPATLTVHVSSKPTLTRQPASVTTGNSTAQFSVMASGAASYQWQYYTGSGWANVTNSSYSGTKSATMTVPTAGRNGMVYRCAVTNSYGTTYSSSAKLTVTAKPSITKQPASVTTGSSTAQFSVTASGATSYQWQYYTGSGWANVTNSSYSGTKSATMTVPTAGRNGMKYRCAVTNSYGTTYSSSAKLTVTSSSKPTITKQPASVTTGSSKATFSVTAAGATSYQWQYKSGGNWYNVTNSSYSGLKSATMTVPTAGRNGMVYRCAVTNSYGTTYSSSAKLTVTSSSKPTISKQPGSVTATAGGTATFSVTAGGAASYQWQYYTGSGWANVTNSSYSGTKSATMTVPATASRNGMKYRCAVTNSYGTTYSSSAKLTVSSAASGYIGNVKTLKFHLPSCGTLPASYNQVIFTTRSEAVAAGYVPCGNCNP